MHTIEIFIALSIKVLVIFFLFLVTAFLLSSPSRAKTDICKVDQRPVTVRLIPEYGKITFNNGHSALQLGTKFGRHGNVARRLGWVTRGLTKTDIERRLSIKILYRKLPSNRICATITDVTMNIGYKQFRVYVARKLRPGMCEYRTTLAHENTHVRIYQQTLRNYVPVIERKLRQSAILSPVNAASAGQAKQILFSKVENAIRPVLNKMNRDMERANGRIDTVENYRREQLQCPTQQ